MVNQDGEALGIMQLPEAMRAAQNAGLDLVMIAPNASPPVCKILDFSKYKYELKQKASEAKKRQKISTLKEVKFRPNIGQGDFEVKMRNILRFLEDGERVKVSMQFRGRELSHPEIGRQVFDKIIEGVGSLGKMEVEPKLEGKNMLMLFVPVTKV